MALLILVFKFLSGKTAFSVLPIFGMLFSSTMMAYLEYPHPLPLDVLYEYDLLQWVAEFFLTKEEIVSFNTYSPRGSSMNPYIKDVRDDLNLHSRSHFKPIVRKGIKFSPEDWKELKTAYVAMLGCTFVVCCFITSVEFGAWLEGE